MSGWIDRNGWIHCPTCGNKTRTKVNPDTVLKRFPLFCPKCGKEYTGRPALSRADNKTMICPDCGIHEALENIGVGKEEQNEILEIIHRSMREKDK